MIGHVFLGRYEVLRLLGEGGMGKVYLARQMDLNRQVVVKVMNDRVAADERFRERFERETLVMARFQHPYVVTLYDASLNDPSGPCIVMEHVRGRSLDQLLQTNGRLPPARAGRLIGQLCEALFAAQAESIIHRDLKPSNIMVVDPDTPRERIKVMDFGLAKLLTDSRSNGTPKLTDTELDFAVGTPGYICPEQVRGDPVDHRGDIYSAGVIAFEMLAGRLPFPGPHMMDMMQAHAHDAPPRFAEVGVEISTAIEDVVMACLAKNPIARPQTAADLQEMLDAALRRSAEQSAIIAAKNKLAQEASEPPTKAFAGSTIVATDDPNSLEFQLEAWMPKRVALLKLRGFVEDNSGEVLESTPGMIRVKFKSPVAARRRNGALRWLGIEQRRSNMFVELRMTGDPGRRKLVQITARFRTENDALAQDPAWQRACIRRFVDLRGYLIAPSESE